MIDFVFYGVFGFCFIRGKRRKSPRPGGSKRKRKEKTPRSQSLTKNVREREREKDRADRGKLSPRVGGRGAPCRAQDGSFPELGGREAEGCRGVDRRGDGPVCLFV